MKYTHLNGSQHNLTNIGQYEDYRNADWTTYQQYIINTLPDINPTNIQDIDTADSTLENIIQQARNIAIPTKRINTYYRRTLPPNIIQTIKMKDKHTELTLEHTQTHTVGFTDNYKMTLNS